MGNLRRQSLCEIWQGVGYRRLRRQLAGTNPPEACLVCNTRPARLPLLPDEMSEAIDFGSPTAAQLGQGFYPAETDDNGRSFRWSAGDAVFFLRNTYRPQLELAAVAHPRMPETPVVITVNDWLAARFTTRQITTMPMQFKLPKFSADVLEIRVSVARSTTPCELGDGDSRRPLGLLFFTAKLIGEAPKLRPRWMRIR